MSDLVDVWLSPDGRIAGIFANRWESANSPLWEVGAVRGDVPRSQAVEEIRRQVFEKDDYQCRHCGEFVTWKTGQMDEIVARGKGGEISVDNCQTLCARCHIVGPRSKHGNRLPQFSKGPQ